VSEPKTTRPHPGLRHIRPARWPTREEARASQLFSPIRLGAIEARTRTWVPAMVPWRSVEEGYVTPDILHWYGRFGDGRPGVLVVEATGIRDVPSGPLLRIGDDRFIPGLKQLVETVRQRSGGQTRLFIQIIDFLTIRRRPEREKYLRRFLALTDSHRDACAGAADDDELRARLVAMSDEELQRVLSPREFEALQFGARERVTDLHVEAIRELPRRLPEIFAAAARRAEAAGFDGVELHYAHAYTLASFLSARNDRADGYGLTLAGRVRLPLEVLSAARERVSERFVVGCRLLSEDCIEGGSTVEDVEYFGVELARAGVDYLSLSRGGKFEDAQQPAVGWAAYPYTGPSGWECMPTAIADARGPFGRNVDPAARIRAAVRAAGFATPVVVAGGIHTFDQAETILREGGADLVAAARQTLADPDWFRKIRLGRGSEVRRCTFTNYCEALDQKHKQVTCKLWDRLDLDGDAARLTADGVRRLVAPPWEP
jgi:2,4-dienoyl-CoA reductase-like NADH-dependent reductase (Old Yellow Enzyme family)